MIILQFLNRLIVDAHRYDRYERLVVGGVEPLAREFRAADVGGFVGVVDVFVVDAEGHEVFDEFDVVEAEGVEEVSFVVVGVDGVWVCAVFHHHFELVEAVVEERGAEQVFLLDDVVPVASLQHFLEARRGRFEERVVEFAVISRAPVRARLRDFALLEQMSVVLERVMLHRDAVRSPSLVVHLVDVSRLDQSLELFDQVVHHADNQQIVVLHVLLDHFVDEELGVRVVEAQIQVSKRLTTQHDVRVVRVVLVHAAKHLALVHRRHLERSRSCRSCCCRSCCCSRCCY